MNPSDKVPAQSQHVTKLTFNCSKSTIKRWKKVCNMFKLNNEDIRTMSMTSFWCFFNFDNILHLFLVFLWFSSVSFSRTFLIHGTCSCLLSYFIASFFPISLEQYPSKHLPVQNFCLLTMKTKFPLVTLRKQIPTGRSKYYL